MKKSQKYLETSSKYILGHSARRKKRMSRKKGGAANKKTQRNMPSCKNTSGQTDKNVLVGMFMEMLNVVKLYHWNTHSYPIHKATDELYARLNENVDKFVEVMLGKDESRLKIINSKFGLLFSKNISDFKNRIYEYREYLLLLNECLDAKKDSDLLNIRDEIVGDLNQFLYLSTLD